MHQRFDPTWTQLKVVLIINNVNLYLKNNPDFCTYCQYSGLKKYIVRLDITQYKECSSYWFVLIDIMNSLYLDKCIFSLYMHMSTDLCKTYL